MSDQKYDQEIIAYCKKEGTRPSIRTPGFKAMNSWLTNRGSSIAKRCDALFAEGKIKVVGLNLSRTEEEVDLEIIAYCEKEGKRPSELTTGFGAISKWLRKKGMKSSISKRCNYLFEIGKIKAGPLRTLSIEPSGLERQVAELEAIFPPTGTSTDLKERVAELQAKIVAMVKEMVKEIESEAHLAKPEPTLADQPALGVIPQRMAPSTSSEGAARLAIQQSQDLQRADGEEISKKIS